MGWAPVSGVLVVAGRTLGALSPSPGGLICLLSQEGRWPGLRGGKSQDSRQPARREAWLRGPLPHPPSALLLSVLGEEGSPWVSLKMEKKEVFTWRRFPSRLLLVFKLEKQLDRACGEKFCSLSGAPPRVPCHLWGCRRLLSVTVTSGSSIGHHSEAPRDVCAPRVAPELPAGCGAPRHAPRARSVLGRISRWGPAGPQGVGVPASCGLGHIAGLVSSLVKLEVSARVLGDPCCGDSSSARRGGVCKSVHRGPPGFTSLCRLSHSRYGFTHTRSAPRVSCFTALFKQTSAYFCLVD